MSTPTLTNPEGDDTMAANTARKQEEIPANPQPTTQTQEAGEASLKRPAGVLKETFAKQQLKNAERICKGLPILSQRIRALASAGYDRGDIAEILTQMMPERGKPVLYQHVRNVLNQQIKRPEMQPPATHPQVDLQSAPDAGNSNGNKK
jgi:hypothetical protein